MGSFNLHGVKKIERVSEPGLQVVTDTFRPVGKAETNNVGGDRTKVVRQVGDNQTPVRPGADPGTSPVQENHRGALSLVMVVGHDAAGID